MVSAADLRMRIDDLPSTINHRRQLPRDLETTKSELQTKLNVLLDPITRLPFELSSQIFKHSLPASGLPEPHPSACPMVFLNVSHSWRDIALATPALWSAIRVDSGRDVDFPKVMERWMARSRTQPLSILLSGALDSDVRDAVHKHAHRLRNIELYLPPCDLNNIATSFPFLKTLAIGFIDDLEETEEYARLDVPTSTSHTAPVASTATPTASAAAPQTTATPHADHTTHEGHAATAPHTHPAGETEPPVEPPKKHGIGAIVEKIVHPIHGSNHTHSHTDTVTVPVAVPAKASDGQAHLAPGGSSVGGIL
ncbi:hypothetical protein C8R43DRAFT_1230867 [Mycena crocata]|nr:hypothetical protein C8R43DRAFT_1230867 [Mycena crocata]